MNDAELIQQFESLGDNCEFGLVQHFVGAEPLGFFRFNYAGMPMLMQMLETEFRDIDRPEDIELVRASSADTELIVRNRRYGYRYHTFRHDPEPARAQQLRVIPFLRDKLVADLRAGEKIFVRKGARSIEEAAALARLMRRYGPDHAALDHAGGRGQSEGLRPGPGNRAAAGLHRPARAAPGHLRPLANLADRLPERLRASRRRLPTRHGDRAPVGPSICCGRSISGRTRSTGGSRRAAPRASRRRVCRRARIRRAR